MNKVLTLGTGGASLLYILAGVFGFAAFAAAGPGGYPYDNSVNPPIQWSYQKIFEKQNILAAPYLTSEGKTPVAVYICLFGILIVVAFATPFSILPMKDSIEEVRGKGGLDKKENIKWTAILVGVCCVLSCAVLSIGQVMTILGATTNSAIGFLLPVVFYLKVERKAPKYTNKKIAAYILFVFICISSVLTLTLFTIKSINGTE